ncbi:MAG: Ig-like domain-containing protein [Clostridia bacterium]|nr:Ig-like domain-containing protein [Clostridia bacterium]
MRKTLLSLLCTALLAACCLACAEGAAAALPTGALTLVDLSRGEQVYDFTPPSGSVYDICVFPAGETETSYHAALWLGDELLAEGDAGLAPISERLSAGATYTLALSGSGQARVEVARHALSRCFELPMALNAAGDGYSKAIARSGDVHWYSITAAVSDPVVLAGLPTEEGLQLEASLFNESGRLLAEATRTAGGAFLMDFMPRAGRAYRVRVSAANGGTGMYSLMTAQGEGGLPEALLLSESALHLNGRESRRLTATVSPEGAASAVFWESSDPAVARVTQGGVVTGVHPGNAVITAYGAGALRARCRVEVSRVPVEGVRLADERLELDAGETAALEWEIVPKNASEPGVTFAVDPAAGIVALSGDGELKALEEGAASVTLTTVDGGFRASCDIEVRPAPRRYRALLVGEQNYAATVASPRLGSANSVAGMRSMLNHLSMGGERFEVATALDVSRDGVLKAIADAFDGAADGDVAVFYITCHGFYADGMTCFQMYDGSILTAQELRLALDRVPGELVVLADCCGSGGIIGRAGTTADILAGIDGVFGGAAGPSVFDSSRYRVLASASVEQDSYRIGFGDGGESDMATVFARAVCEGCGWSIERAARGDLLADANDDDRVSLDELYRYAARRVTAYLALDSGRYVQTVRVSPEGETHGLFERSGRE